MVGIAGLIALILTMAGLSATGVLKPEVSTPVTHSATVHGWRYGYMAHGGVAPGEGVQLTNLPAGELSEEEKQALLYMVEEEKLARDIYQFLYEKWGLPIFQNIARSEQQHIDSLRALLQKYGIEDPTFREPTGSFKNPEITDLYDQLVAEGSMGLVDAIKVGLTIEEKDIYDLQEWLAKVDNEDIRVVFCNLMKGSRNHLRSFYKELQTYGGTYTPTFIGDNQFYSIVQGMMERGSVPC